MRGASSLLIVVLLRDGVTTPVTSAIPDMNCKIQHLKEVMSVLHQYIFINVFIIQYKMLFVVER